MSLFRQLKKLYRTDISQDEDILTEIAATVLNSSKSLALEWLHSLNVTSLKDVSRLKVSTQISFSKLGGHDMDSRPDMVIELHGGENRELIFVESKVGSKQGDMQLSRYADHLVDQKNKNAVQRVSLVFLTRDFEPVTNPKPLEQNFHFRATRWFEFYNVLKAYLAKNSDGLAKQLKMFMEENHMSVGNQFRSTDLVAMENIVSAMALMDETLQGEVRQRVECVFGNAKLLSGDPKQLRTHKRHIVYSDLKNKGFEFLIGYFFPHENPDAPVILNAEFGVSIKDRNNDINKDIVAAFNNWVQSNQAWQIREIDDWPWICISNGKPIQQLMSEKDHVRAVKSHFMALLQDAEKFKQAYPKLSWP